MSDNNEASNSMEMVFPRGASISRSKEAPRKSFITVIKAAASSAKHSFDPHPESSDPNAELTLALDKTLKAYHSQLIALGSAIGTGLFIGSGAGLATAGPIPLLGAFGFVGLTLCPTVFALGEMATFLPYPGGFVMHSNMFIDEAWGAAMGWNYAIGWLVTLPLELIAASITLQHWGQPLGHQDVWIAIFLAGIAIINISGVKWYANVEAGLSVVKVVAIVGFIFVAVLIDLGLGFNGRAVGTSHYYDPGATRNGWWGFCSVLVTAAFAYSGSEIVGLTASEQENPRRDMPKAIAKVFWRIGIFYIVTIFLIGLLISFKDPSLITNRENLTSSASPFVIALKNAGIPTLPGVMNVVILITVLSVANSSVYGSSRVINAMADAGLAPKAFAYVDTMGRPIRCFYLALAFGCLAFLAQLKNETTVFLWLLALSGLSSIISWLSINITHLRFRRALRIHGIRPATLPFQSPLGIIGSWIGIFCNCFIIFIQFLHGLFPVGYENMSARLRAQSFFSSFMAFPLLLIFFIFFKKYKGSRLRGVSFSFRHGFQFDNPHVEWGHGTTLVDLAEIDFTEDSWSLAHWRAWAKENPHLLTAGELWYLPEAWREPIKKLYFPWTWGDGPEDEDYA